MEQTLKCDWIASRLNGGGHSYAAAGVIQSDGETSALTAPRVIQELQKALKGM